MLENQIYPGLSVLGENEIRVVKLHHRSQKAERVSCTLSTVDLSAVTGDSPKQSFNALSYTWGPASRNLIVVNKKRFHVRDNLFMFLCSRSLDEEFCNGVPIFIDQISINQYEDEERSRQVNMMGAVFSSASMVYVWLGMQITTTLDLVGYQSNATTDDEDDVLLLENIASLDYWNRLWVIQEILLAKDIMLCLGPYEMLWQDLEKMYKFVNYDSINMPMATNGWQWLSSTRMARFIDMTWEKAKNPVTTADAPGPAEPPAGFYKQLKLCQHRRRNSNENIRPNTITKHMLWSELLELTASSTCEELKDRVFGVLGLLQEDMKIEANYRNPRSHIFRAVLQRHIRGSLDRPADNLAHYQWDVNRNLCKHFAERLASVLQLSFQSTKDRDTIVDDVLNQMYPETRDIDVSEGSTARNK